VVTIGGMFGRIQDMDDETVTLDAGGTRLRFVKQAVARKYVEEPTEEEAGEGS
jgi:preprotein translocase subunit YajC